jgi:hypothetical protein
LAKREILAGSTNQTVDVFIQDVNGSPLTGLVFNSSGLGCYFREGATGASTQLALVTQTVGGAHTDGGFVQIDATNMPGLYRLDMSDTMVSDVGMLTVCLQGATGMAPSLLEMEIVAVDKFNATNFGLSLVPANVTQLSGDSTAADNAEAFFDGTGYAGTNNVIPTVTAVTTVNGLAANVVTASALATDAVTEIVNAIIAIDVDGENLQEALRIALSILAGESSGFNDGYGTGVFRDMADTKNRATVAVDADGNRTSVTLDGT